MKRIKPLWDRVKPARLIELLMGGSDLENKPQMQETPTHSKQIERLKKVINEVQERRVRIINRWRRKL